VVWASASTVSSNASGKDTRVRVITWACAVEIRPAASTAATWAHRGDPNRSANPTWAAAAPGANRSDPRNHAVTLGAPTSWTDPRCSTSRNDPARTASTRADNTPTCSIPPSRSASPIDQPGTAARAFNATWTAATAAGNDTGAGAGTANWLVMYQPCHQAPTLFGASQHHVHNPPPVHTPALDPTTGPPTTRRCATRTSPTEPGP